jgi:hypothetical protein
MKKKCPFCGSPEVRSSVLGDYSRFLCGTKGPDECGDYFTGVECDKSCFRNCYLRCIDLIEGILVQPMRHIESSDSWIVEIPDHLMAKLQKEVDDEEGVPGGV